MLMLLLQLALEKEELRIHLQASKDAQRQLTAEVDTDKHIKQNGNCKVLLLS